MHLVQRLSWLSVTALVAAALVVPASEGSRPGTAIAPRQAPRDALAGLRAPQPKATPFALEAAVVDYTNAIPMDARYPVLDPSGKPAGSARWRVVVGTGNCCENYLAAGPDGRIYDFGSTYLVFSDDEGKTWKQVRPARTVAATGGEGTIVLAPNGDVLGVTWIPYGGDRVETFKYDAEAEKWFYSYAALHQPFYDRESIAVIPGPVAHLGEEHPYVVVMRGGWPSKNPWYLSFDGLTYLRPNHRKLDSDTNDPVSRWLEVRPDPMLDWIQPAIQSTVATLGRRLALALPDSYRLGSERIDVFDPDTLSWAPFELPRGRLPAGLGAKLVADSTGKLHYVFMTRREAFLWTTRDGGRTWAKQLIPMPFPGARTWSQDGLQPGGETFPPDPRFELVANGRVGILALSIQVHDPKEEVHINYVYKYDISGERPRLVRILQVGDGNLEFGNDVSASGARMDFQSIALLPDGRIVVSFGDETHSSPAVAIEQ